MHMEKPFRLLLSSPILPHTAYADSNANFLMSYDCSPEVRELVKRYYFDAVLVEMKTTNHQRIPELVITRDKLF